MEKRFDKVGIQGILYFFIPYLLWIYFFVGFRTDHLYFTIFLLLVFFATELSRKIMIGSIFFILFWIIYDSMRVLPNYEVNAVHLIEPYNIEKSLFGISEATGAVVTPNEYFLKHQSTFLDFISGFFYLTWVPVPLALGFYFFVKDKRTLVQYSFVFLLTNIFGFFIYYLYPAAPPWYIHYHGAIENFSIPGNAAGLINFDKIVGLPIFENMYNKNANVFAAIPSLHAAYPVVAFYYARKKRLKIVSILLFLDVIGIWFAAVYSFHHYIIDVLLGAFCAIFAIIIFENVIIKTKIKQFLDYLTSLITS